MFKTDILTPAIEAVVNRKLRDLVFCVDAKIDEYSNGRASVQAEGYPKIEDVPVMFVGDSTSGSLFQHEINEGSTGLLLFKGGNLTNCTFIPLVSASGAVDGIDIKSSKVVINDIDFDAHKHEAGTYQTDKPVTGQSGEPS